MHKILRRKAVRAITGLSNSMMYELISKDEFPRPIRLGARASGWIEKEIQEWIEKKIADSRPQEVAQGANHN